MAQEKKPWYEDIKDRISGISRMLENLDTRETLLQKDFAKLKEKVNWIEKLREERNARFRWSIGIIVSILLSLAGLLLQLWRLNQ